MIIEFIIAVLFLSIASGITMSLEDDTRKTIRDSQPRK